MQKMWGPVHGFSGKTHLANASLPSAQGIIPPRELVFSLGLWGPCQYAWQL